MDNICDFVYDGTFDGLLCTVLRCMNMRVMPSSIMRSDDVMAGRSGVIRIRTDKALADRFYGHIGSVASERTARLISDFYLSSSPDKETDLYMLICRSVKRGPAVESDFSEGVMRRVQSSVCALYREAQVYVTSIPFKRCGNMDVAVIEPVNGVLPIIGGSILRRRDVQDLLVCDRRNGMALVRKGDCHRLVYTGGRTMPGKGTAEDLAAVSREFLYKFPQILHCG